MRTGRRIPALLALSLITAPAVCLPAQPGNAAETRSRLQKDAIGGAQLAGRGVIFNATGGVRKPPRVIAKSWMVADATTGEVLAAKDPHGHYLPASTLKVLTAITLIPRLQAERVVKPSAKAANVEGSAVGIRSNWRYSVSDLFHGLMMSSGNDAATALAEANGGLKPTLAQMNAEARRLQALDTEARTPSGLNEGITVKEQHSSAYDLALMAKEGLRNPDFRRYIGARTYKFPAPPTKQQRRSGKKTGGYQIQTHNKLLVPSPYTYAGALGGKNGYTVAAQATFVAAARRKGHTIVISMMHSQPSFWTDATNLLNWGFSATGKVKPAGTLVDPKVDPAKAGGTQAAAGDAAASQAASRRAGDTMALAGGAGGLLLAGLLIVTWMVRRRRRAAASDWYE